VAAPHHHRWAEWDDSTRFSAAAMGRVGRVGRLNKIFNHPPGSGYDTAEVDAFRQEIRDTFLGVRHPRSHRMRPTTSGSGLPGAAAMTCTRLTPSVMKPNRGWRRCGRPTGDDVTDGDPSRLNPARSCGGAVIDGGHACEPGAGHDAGTFRAGVMALTALQPHEDDRSTVASGAFLGPGGQRGRRSNVA
jgi:hypothetical protein